MRHARVIRDDIEKPRAALQRADNLRALAFEDANHRAGFLLERVARAPLYIAPHQHAILVQRGAGGVFRDHDFLQVRIVGNEKTFSLAINADPARHKVSLARLDVTISLGPRDAAGLFQPLQGLLQLLLPVRRPAQQAKHLRHVGRRIIRAAK
jgi:hypothetical protein